VSSLAPRLAIIGFGLLVLTFVGWWLAQNRSSTVQESPPPAEQKVGEAVVPAPVALDTAAVVAPDTAAADTTLRQSPAQTIVPASRVSTNPADTGGRTGGTVLLNPADIHVMDDVVRNYRGWFLIHISSFQESIRARDDVAFLRAASFSSSYSWTSVKGKWYPLHGR
jgi:hypothetical protein